MKRGAWGLTVLGTIAIGVGAYACNSDPDFGPQPFINDVPSSTATSTATSDPPDVIVYPPSDAAPYDVDAAYALGLCKDTCSCSRGGGQYCVGQYTGLTLDQCEIPDAGDGGPPESFRIGCNYIPKGCLEDAGGGNPCPCIIQSLGALPCLPECVIDPDSKNVTLFCPNP
ncbi:MAG TPA: hypothetical protein VF407_18945 [Polyangiaceae bacterium]